MPEDAPRPAPAAIRTALGAIFVSLELSRRTWLIRAARAVPRTPRQLPAFRYRVLEFGPTEIFPPVGAMHRAIPVSADRAAPVGPTHPREQPASCRGRAKSRETWTLRWKEPDSNHRSRSCESSLGCCRRDAGPIGWMGSLSTGRLARRRPPSAAVSFSAGPMVRIHLPPAESPCLTQTRPATRLFIKTRLQHMHDVNLPIPLSDRPDRGD